MSTLTTTLGRIGGVNLLPFAVAAVAFLLIGAPSSWVTLTIAGLAMGMMLFLMASGLSLVFGLMDVLNFGHSAFVSFGAFVSATVLAGLGGAFRPLRVQMVGKRDVDRLHVRIGEDVLVGAVSVRDAVGVRDAARLRKIARRDGDDTGGLRRLGRGDDVLGRDLRGADDAPPHRLRRPRRAHSGNPAITRPSRWCSRSLACW